MIWFDLDDTLFDHSYSVSLGMERVRALYPAFAGHSTDALVTIYNQALNEVYPEYLSGEIDFQEMRRRKLALFLSKIGVSQAEAPEAAEFHRLYDEGYSTERRATPGSLAAVQGLQGQGVDVAVLTNGMQQIQESKLRTIGFECLIPNLLTSERAGAIKPHAQVFHWALAQTGCSAGDVVMVGDNLVNDVEGALGAGIKALYYCPTSGARTVTTPAGTALVISDWRQLPDRLREIQSVDASIEVAQS